jgi:hypothetical protein
VCVAATLHVVTGKIAGRSGCQHDRDADLQTEQGEDEGANPPPPNTAGSDLRHSSKE